MRHVLFLVLASSSFWGWGIILISCLSVFKPLAMPLENGQEYRLKGKWARIQAKGKMEVLKTFVCVKSICNKIPLSGFWIV